MAGSQQKKSASRRSSLAEDQKRRKSGMVMLSDAVRNQEGRLPAIVEGKVYPRQSLEMLDAAVPDYIDAVDHSDSPDIGPPPVAHFDHVDNLDFEHNVAEEGEDRPAEEEVAPTLPRFEGRKKRRESANVFDFKRGAQAGEENTPSAETDTDFSGKMRTASVKPLRTAAKRKMSVREDEKMETWCAIEEPVQADNVPEDENNEGTAEVPPSPEQDDPARTIEEGQKPKRTTTRSRTPDQTRIPAPQENDESPERPALVPSMSSHPMSITIYFYWILILWTQRAPISTPSLLGNKVRRRRVFKRNMWKRQQPPSSIKIKTRPFYFPHLNSYALEIAEPQLQPQPNFLRISRNRWKVRSTSSQQRLLPNEKTLPHPNPDAPHPPNKTRQ